jgi:hypothetical protein
MTVAHARDAPSFLRLSARMLRGDESQIRHQSRCRCETRKVAEFCGEDHGGDGLHAAQDLKRLDQRTQGPNLHPIHRVLGEPRAAAFSTACTESTSTRLCAS